LGTAMLLAAAFASALLDMRRARERTLREEEAELSNLARALAGQTAQSIETVDFLLRDIAKLVGQHALTHERLRDKLNAVSAVDSLAVFDGNGALVASATQGIAAAVHPPDFGGVEGDLAIDPGPASATGGLWLLVARRLRSASGAHSGTIVATMDARHLQGFLSAVVLPHSGRVALYRRDGTVLARVPWTQGTTPSQPDPSVTSALARATAAVVGDEGGIVALQPVDALPLAVGVGTAEQAALAPLQEWSGHLVLRWLIISGLMAGLILVVVRELGRREAADARLRESEERYALAMAGSQEGHWDWDVAGAKLYQSARLMQLLGCHAEDSVTDDNWIERQVQHGVLDQEQAEQLRKALREHFRGNTSQFECEIRITRRGEQRWLLDRGIAMRDASGRVKRMSGSIMDITERKHAEAEQAYLEQRLREAEKLEALGTLAGGIAHDFNNILNAILGYGDMAHRAAPEGSALQRHAGNVLVAARRAKTLVDHILDYSRSQRGARNPVNLRTVVNETLDLLRESLREHIQLEVSCDPEPVVVICDSTQVHQVVMNLCTNAMEAMPAGGTLRVALSRKDLAARRSFSHGTLPAGPHAQLMVSDTGIGMDADLLKRLFEPFFTTKESGAGTGLGLALVHNIVTALGGAIDVQSTPGHGSTFRIYFPRFDAPALEAAMDSVKRGSGQRVMVVEDDKSLLLLAEETLAALGYEPSGYAAAHEAIEALAAMPSQFDAAVIDYVLPGMTGVELGRRLHEHHGDLPIILLSSYLGPMLYQEARSAGILHVLAKPVDAAALSEALTTVISRTA